MSSEVRSPVDEALTPEQRQHEIALLLNRLVLLSHAHGYEQDRDQPSQDPVTDADIDGLEDQIKAHVRALLRERETRDYTCGASRSSDPPQECGWPGCGCDPYAQKVIDALVEQGTPEPRLEALRDAMAALAHRWEGPDKPACWCEQSPILTGSHDERCGATTDALRASYSPASPVAAGSQVNHEG